MESAAVHVSYHVGSILVSALIFKPVELCRSPGNDVCGISLCDRYPAFSGRYPGSKLGRYVSGSKKFLYFIWTVFADPYYGMPVFLPSDTCDPHAYIREMS